MIRFVELSSRGPRVLGHRQELPKWLVVLVLVIILCLQVGLLLLIS